MIKDSGKLIADACRGIRPARTPIFDIFVNDAVIEHFAGRPFLGGALDEETAALAAANALDATRLIQAPNIDGSTWTDVYTTTNGRGQTEEIQFAPTFARRVRLYGIKRSTPFGYSLWEMRVFP